MPGRSLPPRSLLRQFLVLAGQEKRKRGQRAQERLAASANPVPMSTSHLLQGERRFLAIGRSIWQGKSVVVLPQGEVIVADPPARQRSVRTLFARHASRRLLYLDSPH